MLPVRLISLIPMKAFFTAVLCLLSACRAQSGDPAAQKKPVAPGVVQIGRITHPHLTESSGVVVSRRDPALFWTHTDGGGKKQVLYGMTRSGRPLAEYRVTGALLDDWEDIASDDAGHLFLADTGNNDLARTQVAVYQVDEPELKKSSSGLVAVTRGWQLKFPGQPFNCEALFIWRDHGYVVSKVFGDQRAELFRFPLTNAAPLLTMERLGDLKIDSPVTGADISRDGKLLGLVAKNGAYVFRINGDPARATRGKPYHTRLADEHIEACTFVPEGLLVTAESREIYLFTDEPFRAGPPKKK